MAGRPWYAQGADLLHRLTVLSILGYSGYLTFAIGSTIRSNYRNKLLRQQQEQEQQLADGTAPATTETETELKN